MMTRASASQQRDIGGMESRLTTETISTIHLPVIFAVYH
jgi:hypothetical protein